MSMLNLLFLLGEQKPYIDSEELLINILDRLSLFRTAYTIEYCYKETPPTRKFERATMIMKRKEQLIQEHQNEEIVLVCMGWMPTELLTGTARTRRSGLIGARFPIPPFRYDTWFTHDPSAALFDPNLYVDIMGHVSAAIRYARRQIIINTNIKPYAWDLS